MHRGLISESRTLQIPLDNEDLILGYVSGTGRIRSSFIRIPPWDRANKSEVSAYDSTRGRIIYRLRNKDSND
uniref:translation initiation factor 1 n=1 Tax=Reevesia longipetiolata TaxID=197126 RepID=UPI002E75BDC1|nr:translation initiation factor 1 [Reevesia longipetiolata]YP_011003178.1 translation initiation factor 1 [Reevesia tomentosa]YP_011003265.1 translation initiation factor 1 [Reevesia glaucophylla]YP_011003352.1 translation initiation factor 1 [Reevesia membranacea]WPR62573.1 translation initiation factor 1 [Reevesia thyrsoidea]WPR62486.1 translation initiation factor 1 [Reevesia longipetiolata]WPR62660.1 translation initiation factor 1 [Reevesia tomentosa]WPR62747.1 translation initiation f